MTEGLKIASLKVQVLELPYKRPLITASNRFFKAEGLLVEAMSEEGRIGFGYSDLFPRTGETIGSACYAVDKVIRPLVEGKDLAEIGRMKNEIHRSLVENPRVKAAVETALYDLLSQSLQVPLYLLLGGRVREGVKIVRIVSLDEPEKMAEDCRALVLAGFRALKIKISGEMGLDINRVSQIRQAVGDDIFLKVDANESYDGKSAIRLAQQLTDLKVEVLEQPVPRSQIEALKEIKRITPIKVEADQAVKSVNDAYRIIREGAADSINTSLQKAGGFSEARQIAELCSVTGVGCVLSNTAGSMVGDVAALHLAVSTNGVSPLCELGEFEAVVSDPFSGLEVDVGFLKVPEGEGLGVVMRSRWG